MAPPTTDVTPPPPTNSTDTVGGGYTYDTETGKVTGPDGSKHSVMEAFTLCQIDMVDVYSGLAADKINKQQENVNALQKGRQYLTQLRTFHQKGGDHKMPADFVKYCADHKITIPNKDGDNLYGKDELQTCIDNLQGGVDNLQDMNQIDMLKLKTTMNHLDTAITAASKNEDKIYSTTKDIANSLAR